ncbi:hypothetical protein TI39_contig1051g00020 [Zymoseptoria brevis]|uniref:Uncharacterized protein n=1 Tax=Zymoseptoria brevis TaxID=1047168 RepID=A0A0F4GHS5_9PEZI|nr:hypothetical protein TI39_contig1051g00020 [Zymoseptoria brevis]
MAPKAAGKDDGPAPILNGPRERNAPERFSPDPEAPKAKASKPTKATTPAPKRKPIAEMTQAEKDAYYAPITAKAAATRELNKELKRAREAGGEEDAPLPKKPAIARTKKTDAKTARPPPPAENPGPLPEPPTSPFKRWVVRPWPYAPEFRSRQALIQIRSIYAGLNHDSMLGPQTVANNLAPGLRYLGRAIEAFAAALPNVGPGTLAQPDAPDSPVSSKTDGDGNGGEDGDGGGTGGPDDDDDGGDDGAPKRRNKGKGRAVDGYSAGLNGRGEVDGAADYGLNQPEDADGSEAFDMPNEEEDELADPRRTPLSPAGREAADTLASLPFAEAERIAYETIAPRLFGPVEPASRGRGGSRGGRGATRYSGTRTTRPGPRTSPAADGATGGRVEKPTSPKKPASPQKKPRLLKLNNTKKPPATSEGQPPATSPSRNTRSMGKTPPFIEPPIIADDDLDPPKRNQKTKKRNSDDLDLGKSADVKKRDRKQRGKQDEEPPKTVRRSGRKKGGKPEEEEGPTL